MKQGKCLFFFYPDEYIVQEEIPPAMIKVDILGICDICWTDVKFGRYRKRKLIWCQTPSW